MHKFLVAINRDTNEVQEKVTQHVTGYFCQVTRFLQTLTNAILETKILQYGDMRRETKVDIFKKVWLVHIFPQEITIGNEDIDATLRGFKLNEISMHMLTQIQNEVGQEIKHHKVIVHDQLVWSKIEK